MKSLALGLLVLLQQTGLPALTGRVVDDAGILSDAEERELTRRLETIESETSVQFVVATIPTLGDVPIEDFSIRLADAWKIGQAGLDNGAIILVVPSERRIRIEVGYGLEPVIPDGLAGRIIRERIAPQFAQGNYYDGLQSGIEGLELAARKEYPEERSSEPSGPSLGPDIGVVLFVYFLVGVLGNAVSVLLAMVAGAVLFPWVGGSLAQDMGLWAYLFGGVLGLVALVFLRIFGRTGSWTSPGRYRAGGFRGGFGGGGGGFRGGGGGFGGGGASGSW